MKAIKENKVYAVASDEEAKVYKARGFDIYGDDGKLKEHGTGKTVSLEKYEALQKENSKLKGKIKNLEKGNSAEKNEAKD